MSDTVEAELKFVSPAYHAEVVARLRDENAQLRAENARLRAVIARVEEWTHMFGAELKPARADTYGEGLRDAKARVARILESLQSEGEGDPR